MTPGFRKAQDLLKKYPNLYFSFIVEANAETPEDWKDLFWAMSQADKPSLQNWQSLTHSGRYTTIVAKEKSLL